jgi:hypothetical protein
LDFFYTTMETIQQARFLSRISITAQHVIYRLITPTSISCVHHRAGGFFRKNSNLRTHPLAAKYAAFSKQRSHVDLLSHAFQLFSSAPTNPDNQSNPCISSDESAHFEGIRRLRCKSFPVKNPPYTTRPALFLTPITPPSPKNPILCQLPAIGAGVDSLLNPRQLCSGAGI